MLWLMALLGCFGKADDTSDPVDTEDTDVVDTDVVDTDVDDTDAVDTDDTDVAVTCSVSTDNFGNVGAPPGGATIEVGMDGAIDDVLQAQALLEEAAPADVLTVALYADYGAFTGTGVLPGTYQITGDELDFATCGVCVIISTNSDGSGYEDDYMATGGTLTVTEAGDQVGETLTWALTDVTLQHVTIDSVSGETTPVGDGCTTAISGATFSGTLEAPPQ